MSAGIFLIQGDQLVELNERPYDSEDILQELLARYPNLLAGNQIDPEAPRRWVLVAREKGVPGAEDGTDRWWIDNLLLDQDGILTLVEVKRSSDTRIRREVVGQMLDYAANAVAYWPAESIRARFELQCRTEQLDPARELIEKLGVQGVEEYWQTVKTNLQAERIRMVFVADEIPSELRRIVEFLNGQMDRAEVLAVEIRQFVGPGQIKTLVPRVIGLTAEAERKKGSPSSAKRLWNEETFFEDLRQNAGEEEVKAARAILDWVKSRFRVVLWGKGAKQGSATAAYDVAGVRHYAFTLYSSGHFELPFQSMRTRPLFDDPAKRQTICDRMARIPGIVFTDDAIHRRPNVRLKHLANDDAIRQFLEVVDWYVTEIETTASMAPSN